MSATTEQIEALAHELYCAEFEDRLSLTSIADIKHAALYHSGFAAMWSACLDRAASALNPIAQGPVDESEAS